MKNLILIMIIFTSFSLYAKQNDEVTKSEVKKTTEVTSSEMDKKVFVEAGLNAVNPPVEAPNFTLKNLSGENVSLSDYRGKPLMLNFWAHWCPPCKAEMPSVQELAEIGRKEGFSVLAVNLGDDQAVVKNYFTENEFDMDVMLDSSNQIGAMYGVRSIPTTYILDSQGNIVAGKLGGYHWSNEKIVEILKELR